MVIGKRQIEGEQFDKRCKGTRAKQSVLGETQYYSLEGDGFDARANFQGLPFTMSADSEEAPLSHHNGVG